MRNVNHFICQISEKDWLVSRGIGVYGNREGQVKDDGSVTIFSETPRGENTIQSIIEDLIGMRVGDTVFFHVIRKKKGESSLHGVYRASREPFYNDKKTLWESDLVYPYRFCFEPHPDHAEICKFDAHSPVSRFYAAIEARKISSIFTLEREVRGAAHAVKMVSAADADEITSLLYRDFHLHHLDRPIEFQPVQMTEEPLRDHIRHIGRLEFAVKALVAYKLGRQDSSLTRLLPACAKGAYHFLVENFVGQTVRRPVDILCMGHESGGESRVTVVEAKTNQAKIDDLAQALQYSDTFTSRNSGPSLSKLYMSICLLAKRFSDDLVGYASVRNLVVDWEKVLLLIYVPNAMGTDAEFRLKDLSKPSITGTLDAVSPEANILERVVENLDSLYSIVNVRKPKSVNLELVDSQKNLLRIRKRHMHKKKEDEAFTSILIHRVGDVCGIEEMRSFMNLVGQLKDEVDGDFMRIEPIIVAGEFHPLVDYFIQNYNSCDVTAGRHRIVHLAEKAA